MTFPGLTDRRARLMLATLGFLRLEGQLSPVLHALHRWLDSWRGIGDITVGMAHQGYDLQLTRYDERGWRATFYVSGMEHSPTSATGSAWERTAWRAVQGAAWDALLGSRQGGLMMNSGFWIDVRGRFVHLMCYEAGNVRFCKCSAPIGECQGCGKSLRDYLEGKKGRYLSERESERAVWCKACGRKYPYEGPRFCSDAIFS